MSISVSKYTLRTTGISEEDLKILVCGAVGFSPSQTEMNINESGYERISLSEKIMDFGGTFAPAIAVTSEENIKRVLASLDLLASSKDINRSLGSSAATLIRALIAETNKE